MTLTSPIGNSVTLIGPADKNGTNPSPIVPVEHDITFVPSGAVASPDPDLPIDWTNNNVDWGANPPYTGSYFPFNGDFAVEFKQGNVNGIWELTIEDAFINDVGLLRAVELDFCDDSDIVCSPCESRSGAFPSDQMILCSGSDFDYRGAFMEDNFDSSLYLDQFLVYSENVLIGYDIPVDFSMLSPGMYSIYNINVDLEDSAAIQTDLEGLSREEMEEYIDNPGGDYCISRSEQLNVQINEPGDSITLTTAILCNGDFEVFRGDTIRASGTYVYSSESCDSILILPVVSSELVIESIEDTVYIDCNLGGADLNVVATSNETVLYTWTDPGGSEVSTDSFHFQTSPGIVFLEVDDGFCTQDLLFVVVDPVDTMEIEINASIIDLNCRDDSSLISITANFNIQSYTWRFLDSIIGTSESIIIDQMGSYYVDVLGTNGCTKRDTINIVDSRGTPDVELVYDDISCLNSEVVAEVISASNHTYVWSDADSNPLSDSSNLLIDLGGNYNVQVSNDAFCDTLILFTVLADTTSIFINNIPSERILNCEITEIELNPIFGGRELESVHWSNEFEPNLSTDPSIVVSQAATYSLIATAENGCEDSVGILIGIDTISPEVLLTGGQINCTDPVIVVEAISNSTDILYAWSGPFDAQLSDSTIQVSVPSVYTVGLLDTINECLTIDTIAIQSDGESPMISIVGDSVLNCLNNEILVFNSTAGLNNPKWILPNGDSVLSDSILITQSGDYIFTAVASNGCSGSISWSVADDVGIEPLELPDSIFLNCTTPQINLTPTIPPSVRQIEWVVNNDTITAATFQVSAATIIQTNVYYNNGCFDSYIITVMEDMVLPEINIVNDTIDCNNPIVNIGTTIMSDRYNYIWMGAYDGRGDTSFVMVSNPEIITLRIEDTVNGCTASQSVTVTEDTEVLTPTIFRTVVLACDIPVGRIDVSADQEISVEWTDPDGTVFMSPQGVVDRAGPYSIRVIGENGCEFFTDWMVTDIREPVSVAIDTFYTFDCIQPEITVQPTLLEPNSNVFWIYSNSDTISANLQDVTFGTELESVYIVDEAQCDTLIPLSFEVDTTALIANIITPDSVNCDGQDINLIASNPGGSYEVMWEQNGMPNLFEDLSAVATSSGTYSIEIRNTENGCVSVDSVVIRLSDMPIIGAEFTVEGEICLGDMNGSFVLQNVVGGNGASTTMFNNQAVVVDQDVFNLAAGSYPLNIVDDFGCQWDTLLSIDPGIAYNVDLGSDLTVNRGESVLILPTYSGSQPMLNEFNPALSNVSLDTIVISPSSSGILSVISTSIEGCIAADSLFITLNNNLDAIRLFVPNVVSLLSASENNILRVELPDDIVSIDFFKIFDRWGQEIVSFSDIVPGVPLPVWDGSFNGELVEAGVYIYAYQITTVIDGAQKLISGDITVIR